MPDKNVRVFTYREVDELSGVIILLSDTMRYTAILFQFNMAMLLDKRVKLSSMAFRSLACLKKICGYVHSEYSLKDP